MNIGGALGLAGRKPLGEFAWGETVIGICNGHLTSESQLALTDTGNDAYAKIVALTDDVQVRLLSTDLGTLIGPAQKSSVNCVRLVSVVLSVVMALISLFATYQMDAEDLASEEKSALVATLFQTLQTLMQAAIGL